jgi:hypothetical protein
MGSQPLRFTLYAFCDKKVSINLNHAEFFYLKIPKSPNPGQKLLERRYP